MSTTRVDAKRFTVGDWVTFPYGSRTVWAQVLEDRGAIGVNRRRLYTVRLGDEQAEQITFEAPEDDLSSAEIEHGRAIDYLKNGGLVRILQSNLGGGREQPRVWLTFDSRGNVSHTFIADWGVCGGRIVPFFALQENKIFSPKVKEVIDYLSTFGLSVQEAEQVVQAVGISP